MKEFDYTPLTQKITFSERRKQKRWTDISIYFFVALLCFGGALLFLKLSSGLVGFGVLSVLGLFSMAYVIDAYRLLEKYMRLRAFADANDMEFQEKLIYDNRPGIVFEKGHSRYFSQVLRSRVQAFSEVGSFNYTTGSGKNKRTYHKGYVRIKLPRRLPHIVLDSRKNNSLFGVVSNIVPMGTMGSQRLSLEGDFDKYFTLYAPQEYKRDALYIFTPDIMQLMIDSVHQYDCEIIDDDFYIHSTTPFKLTNPSEFKELQQIVHKLEKKLELRTDYYADERVESREANVIALEGVRLKKGVSVIAIITIVIVVLFQLISFIQ